MRLLSGLENKISVTKFLPNLELLGLHTASMYLVVAQWENMTWVCPKKAFVVSERGDSCTHKKENKLYLRWTVLIFSLEYYMLSTEWSQREMLLKLIISRGPTLPATVPGTGDSKQDGHSLPASNSWSIDIGRLVKQIQHSRISGFLFPSAKEPLKILELGSTIKGLCFRPMSPCSTDEEGSTEDR